MSEQLDMVGLPSAADALSMIGKDLGELPESKWAPLLASLVSVLEALYRRQGKDEDSAFQQASDSVMAIAEYFGGRVVYLPRGDKLKAALRDAEIYRRSHRGNIEALAEEHGLTVIHIYRICRQQKALHLRKIQGRLFGE